jgi:hypothetical protein
MLVGTVDSAEQCGHLNLGREQHAIKRAAADEAVNEIKKTINNEKFIDDVVQRIKNKQI